MAKTITKRLKRGSLQERHAVLTAFLMAAVKAAGGELEIPVSATMALVEGSTLTVRADAERQVHVISILEPVQ